jgi:hypothetical protein
MEIRTVIKRKMMMTWEDSSATMTMGRMETITRMKMTAIIWIGISAMEMMAVEEIGRREGM